MNIVKFKDIIITPEESGLTQEQCDLFNEKFHGKYVHCIDWSYVIPIEEMTESDAINVSRRLVDETTIYSESASIMELSAEDVREILNKANTNG